MGRETPRPAAGGVMVTSSVMVMHVDPLRNVAPTVLRTVCAQRTVGDVWFTRYARHILKT